MPAIHDITTDTQNPPAFEALADVREAAPNAVDYPGDATAQQQHLEGGHLNEAGTRSQSEIELLGLNLPGGAGARQLRGLQRAGEEACCRGRKEWH